MKASDPLLDRLDYYLQCYAGVHESLIADAITEIVRLRLLMAAISRASADAGRQVALDALKDCP